MNYLALCKRLRQEASVSGIGPATTLNQQGEMLRLINWIQTAYEEIQAMKFNWKFMTKDFNFQTVAGQAVYTATGVSITDLKNWKKDSLRIYLTSAGVIDEQWLVYRDYENYFRNLREFGSSSLQTGRSIEFSIKPDNSLVLFPIPDVVYTIRGQYFRSLHTLAADSDTPVFPSDFHMAIVWKALIKYGLYESAQEAISQGTTNFNEIYSKLSIDQSFPITRAGALA